MGASLGVSTLSVGQHVISFRADDGEGGVTTATVMVNVVEDIDQLPPVPDALLVGPVLLTIDDETPMPLSIDNENPARALSWDAVASERWLRLSATNGSTPAEVTVSLDPNLGPGHYTATITLNSTAGSKTVAVDATVGSSCVGDCNGDGDVAINELIIGVNIALGNASGDQCSAFDPNGDGVSIAELIQGVNNSLNGCA